MLTFKQYLEGARETATYPTDGMRGLTYIRLGLIGEAGEVCDKVKKLIRDNDWPNNPITEEQAHAIALELGDVLWYTANYCYERGLSDIFDDRTMEDKKRTPLQLDDIAIFLGRAAASEEIYFIIDCISDMALILGYTLEDIARMNYEKLKSRQQRNKLNGSGDYR